MQTSAFLQYVSAAGALYCAAAYLYGFILRPKGDRRFHVASLMFTGMALAALAVLAPTASAGSGQFAAGSTIMLLVLSVLCQSVGAFRGRRSDRRAADQPAAAEEPAVRLVAETPAKAA